MKKIFVTILALFYFAVSSGVILNLHYCMNRFASADFSGVAVNNNCGSCGMHKAAGGGCCHDEVRLLKLQDDQNKTSFVDFHAGTDQPIISVPSLFLVSRFQNSGPLTAVADHAPPLLSWQDCGLRNSVFRI